MPAATKCEASAKPLEVTNSEAELCRFAIIGHGDSWESIHQEIGHRPDVYMPGAVTGEKLAAAVASAETWKLWMDGVRAVDLLFKCYKRGVFINGVPQNGWFIRENFIKVEDLRVPLFQETTK